MGFHASQETVRILGESINFTRLGQLSPRGGVAAAGQQPQQTAALVVPSHWRCVRAAQPPASVLSSFC